jgi:hypothetical protein
MIVQTKQQKNKVETFVTDLVIDIENEKRARKLKKHWSQDIFVAC